MFEGTKGDGWLAWALVITSTNKLSVGSVYAPNERTRRKEMWDWIGDTLPESNLVLCGDWNMVELWDDSVGPHALIHGNDARAWNRLVDRRNLVDNFVCAGQQQGPIFTRQAKKLDRLDQSRLGRSY